MKKCFAKWLQNIDRFVPMIICQAVTSLDQKEKMNESVTL